MTTSISAQQDQIFHGAICETAPFVNAWHSTIVLLTCLPVYGAVVMQHARSVSTEQVMRQSSKFQRMRDRLMVSSFGIPIDCRWRHLNDPSEGASVSRRLRYLECAFV